MALTWESPKSRGEFSESGMVKGCSDLNPLGRLCPALISRVGVVVAVTIGGAGGCVEVVTTWGGVWPWGLMGVPKIWARVTLPLWSGILTRESFKGIATGKFGTFRDGEGLWVSMLPVFFFLLRWGRSTEVETTTMTPKSSRVKGGGELLQYHPSSWGARSEGERMYPL